MSKHRRDGINCRGSLVAAAGSAQGPAKIQRSIVLLTWLVSPQLIAVQHEACARPPENVEAGVTRAADWVTQPVREEQIDAFSPAADIRHRVYVAPRPLRVWIVRVDLTRPGVRLTVTEPANLPSENGQSRETLSANTLQFAQQRGVQLAVNASAFAPFRQRMGMPMDVVGLAAVRGQVYSPADPRFGALFMAPEGRITLKSPPLPMDDLWHVLPGFRMLVDDGAVVVSEDEALSKFGDVNPRTAVGVDKGSRTLWIVVVDGRQPGTSEGITLIELAVLFRSLDVWDALNLDGGGSSTLVLQNEDNSYGVLNTPVGQGKPHTLRQVATNLGLYLPGAGRRTSEDQGTMDHALNRPPS